MFVNGIIGGACSVFTEDRVYVELEYDTQFEALELWNTNVTAEYNYHGAMSSNESYEYSQIATDISTYLEENISKFVLGDKSIEGEWDNFQADLQSMNIARLVELKQTAYDRYISK